MTPRCHVDPLRKMQVSWCSHFRVADEFEQQALDASGRCADVIFGVSLRDVKGQILWRSRGGEQRGTPREISTFQCDLKGKYGCGLGCQAWRIVAFCVYKGFEWVPAMHSNSKKLVSITISFN